MIIIQILLSFKVKGTFKLSPFRPFSSHDARARTLYIVKVMSVQSSSRDAPKVRPNRRIWSNKMGLLILKSWATGA
jgi:hypothetical protein